MRGDTEVEDDAVENDRCDFGGDVVDAPKGRLEEPHTIVEAGQSFARFADRFRVEIEANEYAIRTRSLENRFRVTAAT